MEYVYPAIFHKNGDESYTITYPDLPGCISEGKSLGNAMYMAESALTQWIGYLTDKKQKIPKASSLYDKTNGEGEFVNLIRAEGKKVAACAASERAVKRTVSIPKWMDDQVSRSGLSLSRVLQDALSERLA
jgi:predicted RNase H-like HicB family nuclease